MVVGREGDDGGRRANGHALRAEEGADAGDLCVIHRDGAGEGPAAVVHGALDFGADGGSEGHHGPSKRVQHGEAPAETRRGLGTPPGAITRWSDARDCGRTGIQAARECEVVSLAAIRRSSS